MRIPFRGFKQLADKTVFQIRASDQGLQQRLMLAACKPVQLQRNKTFIAFKTAEHARQWMALVDFSGPVGSYNHCWRWSESTDNILQRIDRNICILQILKEEKEWFACADPNKRPREQIKNISAVLNFSCFAADSQFLPTGDFAHLRKNRKQGNQIGGEIREIHRTGRSGHHLQTKIFLDRF